MGALNLETNQSWVKKKEEELKEPSFNKRYSLNEENKVGSSRKLRKHPTISLKQRSLVLSDEPAMNKPKILTTMPIVVTEIDENKEEDYEERKEYLRIFWNKLITDTT